ncbi:MULTISPECIES: site-specific integrase [unclassified Oceanispirochaeta]|uniref:tyrosine-type recombinase/integrase n=1 Tax=unclassified Oceanispirochaeta TaxID=2635722 RepID=UPI0013146F45|nr:site-specific integrase [Oceanispirochaeta sp. M1]MBF9018616.1 site-specific integrase [Oceanispirochaeta sp. M2]NPD75053.1 site-specific integrase [Oceanispirochaeta sp. M1]
MRYREPFTVFPRKMRSGRIIWYYQTYDDNGKRTTAFSTGQITKSAARATCRKLLKEDKLLPSRGGRITFGEYSKDWWDWDKCQFLKYKRTRRSISRSYADIGMIILRNQILPYFATMRLDEITAHDVEKWLQSMLGKGLSRTTCNHYKTFLSIMLSDAIRREILKEDVSKKIAPLKSSTKARGILSSDMVEKLFKEENRQKYWSNIKCYYANLMAACTGMRMGEVLGLQFSDINKETVSVTKQYMRKHGLSPTKTKESREIPIPEPLKNALEKLAHESDDDFVFSSPKRSNEPLEASTIWRSLRSALIKAGMEEDQIKEKNITFHSWRHYFNTIMRSNNIADSKLQKMTGHKSMEMTDHYTHYQIDDLKDIGKIQAKILPFSNAG